MSLSMNCMSRVAARLQKQKMANVQLLPSASNRSYVTRDRMRMKVKRVKLAQATAASSATSATYAKKKLPWLAWNDIMKRRMKTRTSIGRSTASEEKRATRPMHTVQMAVPTTRILFRENMEPKRGAMSAPIICTTPVKAVPIVAALSEVNTLLKMMAE